MAKNRKNQTAAIRVGAAVKAVFLCLLIGGSALGYVWHQDQLFRLGQQCRQLELKLEALRRQNETATISLLGYCSPNQLTERVRKMNLGLEVARPGQNLHLPEPQAPEPREAAPAREAKRNLDQSADAAASVGGGR